eukprot:CAMPEP_0185703432 /NCGR_PEP_ID=MMETSP1164-20130828/14502_1 /TAXON_ID=1104430 /ORGANISM="Chrysoreinhardia sp, Strain CCMP2950" /LENGTH=368 /DNA_ID=CAMNT_0028370719 /DNA_START=213 /DNA_END=1315 /DNA_ORIENTATION=-
MNTLLLEEQVVLRPVEEGRGEVERADEVDGERVDGVDVPPRVWEPVRPAILMIRGTTAGEVAASVEQRKPADAEEGVEDVGHVPRSIGDAAVGVLAAQDEPPQRVGVDPVVAAEDAHRAEDPPRVAHVGLLLGAPVEAAAVALPLGEPPAEQIAVDGVAQVARDGEGRDAAEDLARVRLGARDGAVAAVEVAAAAHEARRGARVDEIEAAEDGERRERAVREPRVDLAPLVAAERAVVAVLERRDVVGRGGGVASVELAEHRERLERRQRVQQVSVLRLGAAEAARVGVLAPEDPRDERRRVEHLADVAAEDRHRRDAPIHPAHAHILREHVLEALAVLGDAPDVRDVALLVERGHLRGWTRSTPRGA